MRKNFLRLAALLAMFAVILGAFGAHALRESLSPESLAVFNTGVRYQFYHALALFGLGILMFYRKTQTMIYAGWCFVGGIVLFSGSLYLLSTREILGFDAPWLGPITPLGGLLFIIGWAMLFTSTYQDNQRGKGKSKN